MLTGAMCAGLCTGQALASTHFNDITVNAGISGDDIQSPVDDGEMAGGIAWIDYNKDGFQDLFIPNISAGPSRLFKNNIGVLSAGVAVGDYDGDGFEDIFVANYSGRWALE